MFRVCSVIENNGSRRFSNAMNVFDRKCKRKQRDRAALLENPQQYDYIRDEIGYRLADRVFDIQRKFTTILDLGCGRGHVSKYLNKESLKKLIVCDNSEKLLQQVEIPKGIDVEKIHVDEENEIPISSGSLDMIISNLSLHWINDLPGVIKRMFGLLKDDGVFLASMFGGQTLFQLRVSFMLAELEREGGFAAHVSPLTDVQDIGGILQHAGFTLLTIDSDEVTVSYPSIVELMQDLRGMGENNCAWNRKLHLHKDSIAAAAAIYNELYGNSDGSIPATFQVFYMIGWKPHESQTKPARRGSATVSLKDIQNLDKLRKK